ncbi:MAG TPA: hypothetical protein VK111_13135 [Virgibacillus sp.]|nr:hypothetical protein [Virgibacillus sp.]
MKHQSNKDKKRYSNLSNVDEIKNNLVPEEFPEGSFGSPINQDKMVDSSKSTPWKDGQRRRSAYNYAYKDIHEDLPRRTPGAHPTHDKPNDLTEDD